MPVTFDDERSQGHNYVDPAVQCDTSTRLLGREKYENKEGFLNRLGSHSNGKFSSHGTALSEYKRAYSRCGSPDNELGNLVTVNTMDRVDHACHQETSDVHDDKGITSQTNDSSFLKSQNREHSQSTLRNHDIRSTDNLAKKAFYTTSTQKLYQGADWCNRLIRSPSPPKTSKEVNADTVSFRFESKRYEPIKERWQQFGSRPFSWDYIQTRDGHHIPGPVRFCSPHKKIAHIPGYTGHVSGGPGEIDDPKSLFHPSNKQRTLQPKYTDTARKGNIPGYTGSVQFFNNRPACIDDPEHFRSTTGSTYRPHDEIQCNSRSPFKKSSPMSRTVTLTHPYNPFNQVH